MVLDAAVEQAVQTSLEKSREGGPSPATTGPLTPPGPGLPYLDASTSSCVDGSSSPYGNGS